MLETLTHATTIPQPIAWASAAGHCPVLMSDARPGMEHEGKLIGIHASGARLDFDEINRVAAMVGVGTVPIVRGALIGVARLVGVIQRDRFDRFNQQRFIRMSGKSVGTRLSVDEGARLGPWWRSDSKWGLLLVEAVLLPEPIPMRGAGGLWRIGASLGPGWQERPDVWQPLCATALEQWRKARAR